MSQPQSPFPRGALVKLSGNRLTWEVVGGPNSRGELHLASGALTIWVSPEKLSEVSGPRSKSSSSKVASGLRDLSDPVEGDSIDLHGMRAREAIEMLERAVDRALLRGHSYLDVIHGIGSGALKKAVTHYAKTTRQVKSFSVLERNSGTTRFYL